MFFGVALFCFALACFALRCFALFAWPWDGLGRLVSVRVGAETRNVVVSAQAASLHSACLLGQVSFAANNHKAHHLDENMVVVTLRHSDPKPRSHKWQRAGEGEPAVKVPKYGRLARVKRVYSPMELGMTPRVKRPCDKARLVVSRATSY